jgi:formylglycine-generating enzyme required for sulfatase activity
MRTVWILLIAILMMGVIGCGKTGVVVKPGTKIGDVRVNPTDGAEMVWVPAGEFTMGSTDEQAAAALKKYPTKLQETLKVLFDAEKPQHKLHLNGYWMYKYEVTVAQYRKFCEATKKEMPEAPSWGWKDNHPMVMVSWQEAAGYAKWAGVALPTEAQWEKAARGTDGRIYPWGNDWDASKCANSVGKELESMKPIGSYPTDVSPYGCMDMAGNVYEWCADWYDPNYYKNSPTKNPTGPSGAVKFELGGISFEGARVLRGGSWNDGSDVYFRCASRSNSDPAYRLVINGFRCARTP